MSEKIEPALTAEEWASVKHEGGTLRERLGSRIVEPRQTIAIANDILEQSDPRKITREKIEMMRRAAWNVPEGYSGNASLGDFADALEAYLPPV